MSIKTFKPTTPSRRQMTVSGFDGIDKKAKPEPSLTEPLKKSSGRNSYGRITVRHRGGGNKQKYRIIDFKRDKEGTATVINLQYDPNRSANIALIQYEDGEKRYILAPVNLKAGHKIMTGPDADILPGNCLPISKIPVGELRPAQAAVRTIRDTVATPRLDAVLAAGFSLSRSKAAGYISSGRVALNHRECLKGDKLVEEGDVLTCRGLGKCVLTAVLGQSRKGRTMIELERYV